MKRYISPQSKTIELENTAVLASSIATTEEEEFECQDEEAYGETFSIRKSIWEKTW